MQSEVSAYSHQSLFVCLFVFCLFLFVFGGCCCCCSFGGGGGGGGGG